MLSVASRKLNDYRPYKVVAKYFAQFQSFFLRGYHRSDNSHCHNFISTNTRTGPVWETPIEGLRHIPYTMMNEFITINYKRDWNIRQFGLRQLFHLLKRQTCKLRWFTVVSQSCSLTSYVVSLTCWVKEQCIYACIALFRVIAERTRYIHEQRSLRFLSKTT